MGLFKFGYSPFHNSFVSECVYTEKGRNYEMGARKEREIVARESKYSYVYCKFE